jgi:hypothetical protein
MSLPEGHTPEELVRLYLKGQNLEQIRQVEDAVELYEQTVAAKFDAMGPYDRLIAIYTAWDRPADVARVASAALENVRTFENKRAWYASLKEPSDSRGAEF